LLLDKGIKWRVLVKNSHIYSNSLILSSKILSAKLKVKLSMKLLLNLNGYWAITLLNNMKYSNFVSQLKL
jgi:hypothetical protein